MNLGQNGQAIEFSAFPDLVLTAALEPVSYTWSQRGIQSSSISINFANSPVRVRYHTVNGRQDNRAFALAPGVIVLDDNVISQYELAARRYLLSSGGTQTFQAFTPQEALPGTITLSSAGAATIEINGRKEVCQHLILSTNLARIDLWVDQGGRLLRMERASAQVVAIRAH